EPLAFALQSQDALARLALTRRLGLLKVLGEQLQVEAERADVVLDLVDEPARQLGELGVVVGHRASGKRGERSALPPDTMIPTRVPATFSGRFSSAASGTADDGSTTIFIRSMIVRWA